MQNRLIIFGILLLILIPVIYADAGPHPGGSPLYLYISNMDESQDYVLIAMANHYGQCGRPIEIIGEDGLIPDSDCYRDDIAISTVYAVKKSDFSKSKFETLSRDEKKEYVLSLQPVIVIENVPTNTAAARLSSTIAGKTSQYYDIDFSRLKEGTVTPKVEPDKHVFEADYPKIILSFVLTFIVEFMVILIFMRKSIKKKITKEKIALYVFLINLATWPIANFLMSAFLGIHFLITELLVILAESLLLIWALKVKYPKALLISSVANFASFLVGLILSAILLSAPIVSETTQEKESKFDASAYPFSTSGYPELFVYKTDISERYAVMLQDFYEEFFEGHEFECFSNPTVSKLSFNYLKPKQNLYLIAADCGVPGDTRSVLYETIVYVTQGNTVMFQKKDVAAHFTEVFNNIENLDELKEYAELYVDELAADLGSAIKNAHWSGLVSTDFENGCEFYSELPQLTSTVSQQGDGFVYEGFRIEPEVHARAYYLKYSITPDGQVVKDKEEMVAFCEHLGIIY